MLATGSTLGQGFTSEFTPRFGVDGLSGLFLGALGLVAAAALVFSRGYLEADGRGRTVAVLTALLVLVLAGVFCARDPLTFLTGWELMTLMPAVVILVARDADRLAREPSSSTWPSRISAVSEPGSRSCSSRAPERSATRPRSAPARASRSRSR